MIIIIAFQLRAVMFEILNVEVQKLQLAYLLYCTV